MLTWHPCDVMLAFSGGYRETSFRGKGTAEWAKEDHWAIWISHSEIAAYHWLLGNVPIITRHYDTHGTMPNDFEPIEDFVRRINCVLLLPAHQFPH